jgi:hypothetical protein
MPDLDLVTAGGTLRVSTLLHGARPVLLNLGHPGRLDITPWADRVQLISVEYVGPWRTELGLADATNHLVRTADCSIVHGCSRDRDDRDLARTSLQGSFGSILRVLPAWLHGRSPSDSCRNYPRVATHPSCQNPKVKPVLGL